MTLINKEWNVHTFVFDCGDVSDSEAEDMADKIEAEIKDYARCINILIHDVRAKLDYDIICKKATEGLLYITEDVVMPNGISDMEAFLYPYIDQLQSSGHEHGTVYSEISVNISLNL